MVVIPKLGGWEQQLLFKIPSDSHGPENLEKRQQQQQQQQQQNPTPTLPIRSFWTLLIIRSLTLTYGSLFKFCLAIGVAQKK